MQDAELIRTVCMPLEETINTSPAVTWRGISPSKGLRTAIGVNLCIYMIPGKTSLSSLRDGRIGSAITYTWIGVMAG
jgi:hypothetical protein